MGSFIKQSFRQLVTRKYSSFIQIIGLGIGLGCVILMLTYILHEYSFDKYHANSPRIYRVVYDQDCSTPCPLGEAFKAEIPGIKGYFRIHDVGNAQIKKNNEFIKEENFLLADSSVFSILDIPIVAGHKNTFFTNPESIVISDKVANKYFEGQNPVGKTLEVNIAGTLKLCTVTGVYRHFPSNSSLHPDFIGNIELAMLSLGSATMYFSNTEKKEDNLSGSWEQRGMQTFILTSGKTSIADIEAKGTAIFQSRQKNKDQGKVHLQPFNEMYFNSVELWNIGSLLTSNISSIKLFEGIAILILVIACFNYILLSTAETQSQMKEIACRKVIGATRTQIAAKIYMHAITLSMISLLPAILFVNITIPWFNRLFDKNIDFSLFSQPVYLLSMLGVTILSSLIGGSYIVLYIRRLTPVNLLKPALNKTKSMHSGGIVAFQFVAFILLVCATAIMMKQIRFSQTMNQGFSSKNMLIFKLDNMELRNNVAVLKSKLLSNSHVQGVATSAFTPPGQSIVNLNIGMHGTEPIKEEGMFLGAGLIELLNIPFVDGQSFADGEDGSHNLIINEMAAKKYKVKAGDLLGTFKVRGILKNFHVHSLHTAIQPLLIIRNVETNCFELAVKTDGNNAEVAAFAKQVWNEVMPTALFNYQLLDDRISTFYNKERKQAQTVFFFSSLAIFLAIIGLMGYVAIITLKRTKEIGVRRVNGATVAEILAMLNKDFIKWVAIAFIIATPIAWYAMHQWLQNFAYKTELSWWVFALAGVLALAVALLTVSWQSWRAATRNPVESLRYE
ncbi:MAG TPA: FtsX-like permease family protein [Bacteroidales bacterium]|nr:FtsX-like permease family protein [Bacteroidales bacterium]